MSNLQERISQVFPDEHVFCIDDHMLRRPPVDASRDDMVKLAEPMSALANTSTGGVLLVGIAARPSWASDVGVAHLRAWRSTIRDLARALSPRPTIEIQPGREGAQDVLAVRVRPIGPANRVVRPGAQPLTIRRGTVVPWYEQTLCPIVTPFGASMRSALRATSLLDIDGQAADFIGLPHPVWWSVEHRHQASRWGLVADDGVTLTRMGGITLAAAGRTRRVIIQLRGQALPTKRIDTPLLLLRDAMDEALQPVVEDQAQAIAGLVVYLACVSAHDGEARVHLEARPGSLALHTSTASQRSAELERVLGRFTGWSVDGVQRALDGAGIQARRGKSARGVRFDLALENTVKAAPRSRTAPVTAARSGSRVRSTPREGGSAPASDRASELLACLSPGSSRTRRELQDQLGWSRSKLRNALEAAITRGELVREASSPRSPHQSYRRV